MRKLVLLLAVVVATSLLCSGLSCSPTQEEAQEQQDAAGQGTQDKKDAPAPTSEPSAPREQGDAGRTPPKERSTAEDGAGTEVAVARAEEAPDYETVADGAGALSVEVPSGWEDLTGADSEVGSNWSSFAGASIASSITATPDLDAWHSAASVPGVYVVASRSLAGEYTDDELVAAGPNDFSWGCEAGARNDYERGPYSGMVQEWKSCGDGDQRSAVTLAAAPEGRECVVLLQVAGMRDNADVEASEHIVDTFEANCRRLRSEARVPTGAPVSAPTSASAAASTLASASASAQGELICDEYGCMTPEEVARQKALAESGTEAWWPGSGIERPQPNNCSATQTKADGC